MKQTIFWCLILLNTLLLVTFLGRFTHENSAVAQAAQQTRRPGDYIMLSGDVTGGNSGVVYVVDTTNALLSGITYDENTKRLVSMPKIDLQAAFSRAADQAKGAAEQPRRGR